jgi:hypothetical protein
MTIKDKISCLSLLPLGFLVVIFRSLSYHHGHLREKARPERGDQLSRLIRPWFSGRLQEKCAFKKMEECLVYLFYGWLG